jgi:hypothetical protein
MVRKPKRQITIIQSHFRWPLNKERKINNNVNLVKETLKNCKEHKINSRLMSAKDQKIINK